MIHIFELFAKKIIKDFSCEPEISEIQIYYILIKLQINPILVQGGRSCYRPSLAGRIYHN